LVYLPSKPRHRSDQQLKAYSLRRRPRTRWKATTLGFRNCALTASAPNPSESGVGGLRLITNNPRKNPRLGCYASSRTPGALQPSYLPPSAESSGHFLRPRPTNQRAKRPLCLAGKDATGAPFGSTGRAASVALQHHLDLQAGGASRCWRIACKNRRSAILLLAHHSPWAAKPTLTAAGPDARVPGTRVSLRSPRQPGRSAPPAPPWSRRRVMNAQRHPQVARPRDFSRCDSDRSDSPAGKTRQA